MAETRRPRLRLSRRRPPPGGGRSETLLGGGGESAGPWAELLRAARADLNPDGELPPLPAFLRQAGAAGHRQPPSTMLGGKHRGCGVVTQPVQRPSNAPQPPPRPEPPALGAAYENVSADLPHHVSVLRPKYLVLSPLGRALPCGQGTNSARQVSAFPWLPRPGPCSHRVTHYSLHRADDSRGGCGHCWALWPLTIDQLICRNIPRRPCFIWVTSRKWGKSMSVCSSAK
ncbi:Fanconi anemia core complex-associated protein 20 isoform X2 [Manis pentadactyla]|uniref:Fanconi anemia core complex-associated protein 20 isoform X2 n=1 Tax=Manis pentadactyla TaxID=143292 RepID=UPI00255C2FEA|nr:Fanconi anemia core complex-associated protein 20 isoform X2 [Manis pentadactyla]